MEKPRKSFPAFLFYPADWVQGTQCMTLAERGAYITLLVIQFTEGKLTDRNIRRALGAEYGTLWPEISDKFVEIEAGIYENERMRKTLEDRQRVSESASERGKKGGRPKGEKEKLKQSRSFANDNDNDNKDKPRVMDEIVETNTSVPKKDDTIILGEQENFTLADNSRTNSEAAKIEREFATLFKTTFAQHGKINPSRVAFIQQADLAAKELCLPRGEAAAHIVSQAAKYRALVLLEGTEKRYQPHCETWLESGDWRKDYDALRDEAMRQRRAAGQGGTIQRLDQAGAQVL